MSDIDEKNYPIFIDDSELFTFPYINLVKEFRCPLEQSLRFLKCDKEKWRRFLADNDLRANGKRRRLRQICPDHESKLLAVDTKKRKTV